MQNGESFRIQQGGKIVVESGGQIEYRDGAVADDTMTLLKIKSGTGAIGTATLSNGVATVSTSKITNSSYVHVFHKTIYGIAGNLSVPNRTAADASTLGSFDIVSDSADDQSSVSWVIVEPEA